METKPRNIIFIIKSSQKTDAGEYELKLANRSGEKKYKIQVIVLGMFYLFVLMNLFVDVHLRY